jgi:hypothetical protein
MALTNLIRSIPKVRWIAVNDTMERYGADSSSSRAGGVYSAAVAPDAKAEILVNMTHGNFWFKMTGTGVPSLLAILLLFSASLPGQQHSQGVPQKAVPTLGFSHAGGTSPILDEDALEEEYELKKKLPDNEFVGDRRAFHQAALMNDFVDAFKALKECNGITLYMKSDKKPDFLVQIGVFGHDRHPDDQTWTWILLYPGDPSPKSQKGHGMGGMGSQTTAKLTARDVCLTVWDDVDPNHFKKPGGKVE